MTHCLRTYDRGVLRVTLNRPARRNALSRESLRELRLVLDAHAAMDDLRLAVIGGAGELAFCAGADLAELAGLADPDEVGRYADEARAALDAVRVFPVPTIAALNGAALGGGAELALACDMRLAAPHARLAFNHADFALPTGWGGGADLARLAGAAVALELLATGRSLAASEALALGLLNRVAPQGEAFIDFVDRFAAPMVERPPALLRALKAQASGERLGWSEALRRAAERDAFVAAWGEPARAAAIEAWRGPRR